MGISPEGDLSLLGACGIVCTRCKYLGAPCQGCGYQKGNLFHGSCEVYACVADRGHEHCGECAQFPCDRIISFATDPEHGFDNRLEYLYRRRQVGSAQFLRELPKYGGDLR